ncbi:MAG TPA: hypothetical protein VHM20_08350 [Gammaproteobacteria bacterium]|jgi:hypothetical protein|nr:hypothetical protein [Gammaproteobacteria bacterium]
MPARNTLEKQALEEMKDELVFPKILQDTFMNIASHLDKKFILHSFQSLGFFNKKNSEDQAHSPLTNAQKRSLRNKRKKLCKRLEKLHQGEGGYNDQGFEVFKNYCFATLSTLILIPTMGSIIKSYDVSNQAAVGLFITPAILVTMIGFGKLYLNERRETQPILESIKKIDKKLHDNAHKKPQSFKY